jgi:hypothetical protein
VSKISHAGSTCRSVFPEVTTGVLFSVDVEGECFDSTILAMAGSSGGLIVSEDG